jgi:hypothetical protein
MRRPAALLVALAFLAMPVTLVARVHNCAAMPCCQRMCCLLHSRGAANGTIAMPCHHNARLPVGFCRFSDPCHGHAHWGLTALILPTPPPVAQSLPLPETTRNPLAFASPGELGGFGDEPFEPPRS